MEPLVLIALACFGALSGMLAGLLGVGGGIFMVPFLVLAIGFSQHDAQATSLLVILPTALVATWSLHRQGAVDLGRGLRMGVAGVVGGALGALIALEVSGAALRVIFAVLLAVVGLKLLRDSMRMAPER